MAKKDWKLINKEPGWYSQYTRAVGDWACDILAYGAWKDRCEMRFYHFDSRFGWDRVTSGREPWNYVEDPEQPVEFESCYEAEKFAKKWLGKESAEEKRLKAETAAWHAVCKKLAKTLVEE